LGNNRFDLFSQAERDEKNNHSEKGGDFFKRDYWAEDLHG
jgi:hypothetical protein